MVFGFLISPTVCLISPLLFAFVKIFVAPKVAEFKKAVLFYISDWTFV